jgi:hypothetical protein
MSDGTEAVKGNSGAPGSLLVTVDEVVRAAGFSAVDANPVQVVAPGLPGKPG